MRIINNIYHLVVACFLLNGCLQVHKGYKFEDKDPIDIKDAVSKKLSMEQIINKFGSPSFINVPINDTICYIDAEGKRVSFNRFFRPNYQFICIVIDENKIAKEFKQMSLTKIEKAKMVKYNISFKKPL